MGIRGTTSESAPLIDDDGVLFAFDRRRKLANPPLSIRLNPLCSTFRAQTIHAEVRVEVEKEIDKFDDETKPR